LDRIPNMAGLCRSAEIFSVDQFVLPDISVVQSKDFQTVCMTSDQWLPIIQVEPLDLPSYLTTLRKSHYTIIALEQSSNSLPLHTFTFPSKFCLLLGNEREGIPADLLHLCDVCLEIPQFGVVRSLNVHVAGSLVLWQARQQQLLQSRSEK
jgi:tRNA guanosine-2'-O-methyltransferase